jgi:hypothetical protein
MGLKAQFTWAAPVFILSFLRTYLYEFVCAITQTLTILVRMVLLGGFAITYPYITRKFGCRTHGSAADGIIFFIAAAIGKQKSEQ